MANWLSDLTRAFRLSFPEDEAITTRGELPDRFYRALVESLGRKSDPDLVLDVRIVGVRPDELDIQPEEIESALAPSFLKVRVRDVSLPALTEGALPSAETIAGAFIRDLEARIAELEATPADDGVGDPAAEAAELRDALRLGRLLLAGHEVSL